LVDEHLLVKATFCHTATNYIAVMMHKCMLFMKYCYNGYFLCHIQYFCVFKVDLLNYKPNREWNLMSATARKHLEEYRNNATFPWIQYSFVMQRHSSLYEATLVVSALSKKFIVHIKIGILEYTEYSSYICLT